MATKKKVSRKTNVPKSRPKTKIRVKRKAAPKTRPLTTATTKKVVSKTKSAKKKSRKKKAARKVDGTCFVLMPFKEPFDTYYKSILRPAVIAANLDPLRGDSIFTPTPIMSDVWKMIQEAKVLVAELTEKNANVFYELGLAHAIGKPVVLITETMDDVPFDLQQLRVIVYDKDDPAWGNKLKNSITAFLSETLAEPVDAVPLMFRKRVKSQAPADSDLSIRLDSLERQVSSMALGQMRGPRGSLGIVHSDLEMRGFEINSRKAALEWVRQALELKMSTGWIERRLHHYIPDAEVDTVMALALKRGRRGE